MQDYKDSWKNSEVFRKQLDLNLKELKGPYPFHWDAYLMFIRSLQPSSILDVGCGCGALAEVTRVHFPKIKYMGVDYSQEAIDTASKQWPFASFEVMDYKSLTPEFVCQFDVVNMCSLHNILPDGDEAMEFTLSLGIKTLILGKIVITSGMVDELAIYNAYGIVPTHEYRYGITSLMNSFESHGYTHEVIIQGNSANYLLRKI